MKKARTKVELPPGAPPLHESDVGEIFDCKDTGEIRVHAGQGRAPAYCTLVYRYTYASCLRDPQQPSLTHIRTVDVESDPLYVLHNIDETWQTKEGVDGYLVAELVTALFAKAEHTIASAIRNRPVRVALLKKTRLKEAVVRSLDETEER